MARNAILGGTAAAVLLLGGLTVWLTSGSDKADKTGGAVVEGQQGEPSGAHGQNGLAARDPVRAARAAISSIIPSISCSWLNVSATGDFRNLNVTLGGVAGDPSEAQSEVASALNRASLANANIDGSGIAPIEPGGCSVLDAYRQIPKTDMRRLTTPQLVWHRNTISEAGDYKGQHVAKTIVSFSTGDPQADLTLVGIEPSGVITPIFASRAELERDITNSLADFRAGNTKETNPTKIAPDQYQFKVEVNHEGWSGLALITGKGPFPADVVRPGLGARNIAWQNRFATIAQQQGWKADMLWFRVENQRGGD